MWAVFRALERGWSVEELHELTKIDPWFLTQFSQIVELCRSASAGRPARHVGRPAAHAEARRLRRSRISARSSAPTKKRCAACAARARARARLQAHRHLRGGVRVVHAVSLRHLRAGVRGRSDAAAQGRHPRQRPEPDRPGDRVRLLLLSRRVRPARGRLRDGDDQLQPGDGLDRLRHGRSAVLRAADVRGRLGDHRARGAGRRRRLVRRAVRRADAAEAVAAAAGGRHHDPRHVAGFDRPRRGSRAVRAAAVGSRDSAGAERHGDERRRGARRRREDRLPAGRAPVLRARRPRHGDRLRHRRARSLHDQRGRRPRPAIRS